MNKRALRAVVPLLAIIAGLAIAACGSSNKQSPSSAASAAGPSSTGTSSTGTSTTAGAPGAHRGGLFSSLTATQKSCLKSHGVTLPSGTGRFRPGGGTGTFTRPTGGGAAASGSSSTGHSPGAGGFGGGFAGGGTSKFASAFKACGVKVSAHFGRGFAGAPGGVAGGSGAGGVKPTAAALKTFVACVDKNGYDLKDSQLNTSSSGSILPTSLEHDSAFIAAARPCAKDLFSGVAPPSGAETS